MKVAIMPKGQFPQLKDAICNIPIETMDITNTQGGDSSGLLMVKLKRKLNFWGHVYFQAVSPEFIHATLSYLKENNVSYSNINIDMDSLLISLTNLSDEELTNSESRDGGLEENYNPLYRVSVIPKKVFSYQIFLYLKKSILLLGKEKYAIHY